MKKLFLNLILLFSIASLSSCGYNSMVEKQEAGRCATRLHSIWKKQF
jgi:hypothetical protein